ncbi:MAG: hypothetical protein QM627_08775 [Luteolibacter sp.]
MKRKRVSSRKRLGKTYRTLAIVFGGWMLLMAGIVIYFYQKNPSEAASGNTGESKRQMAQSLKDQTMLHAAMPKAQETLMNFLKNPTPEGKAQFVDQPSALVGRMIRFYQANPVRLLEVPELRYEQSGILRLGGQELIETRWLTHDQKRVEAVFRKVESEVRLDWLDFVCYSDSPLSLFFSEEGEAEGEFRLLARQRQIAQEDGSRLSVVFYEPDPANPQAVPTRSSPAVSVDRRSSAGQLLEAAFRREETGQRVGGSSLPKLEPEGFIRVRVKLGRTGTGEERKFTIREVLAIHWLNVSHTGME